MDIEVAAKLFAHGADELGKAQETLNRQISFKPIHKVVGGSAVGAAPLLVEAPMMPAVGRVWNVLMVALYSADGHTSLANAVADVYASASGIEDPDFSAQILSGINTFVPSVNYFPQRAVWIHSNEKLLAWVYGFASSAPVQIIARIAEYPVEAVEALSA